MKVFFRNDDVRETLDDSLIDMTNIFIKHNIPICHAVEPANVSAEVIDWLNNTKKKHPNLLEIVQHGYCHKLNVKEKVGGKIRQGEFGGNRSYKEQYDEILKGKELLDSYFGKNWFQVFTFPYGARNDAAINAVNNAEFLVLNGGYSPKIKYRIFYLLGKILRKRILFGRRVSYNLNKIPSTNLMEIDVSFGFIKRYINDDFDCEMHSLKYLQEKFFEFSNQEVVGILFHHRFHNNKDKIKLIDDYLIWIKKQGNIKFCTQEDIYKFYA